MKKITTFFSAMLLIYHCLLVHQTLMEAEQETTLN